MTYSLGVDLGTTTTAAAVWRNGRLEACTLGDLAPTMPSVALQRPDGSVVVGEPARDRALYETTLVARHITARLDGGEPILLDGVPHDPVALTRALLEATVDRVRRLQGGLPDRAVLTYPLFPGGAAAGLIEHVATDALGGGLLIPSPIAAVAKLAYDVDVAPGTTVAVLDFGGGTFEVTLVRRSAEGFDVIGPPSGVADFGGVEVDAAVLARVESVVGDVSSSTLPDADALAALRRLRTACRAAKERLAHGRTAVVDVALPGLVTTQVSISRAEIEADIRPRLVGAVDLVAHAAQAAGVALADVHVALLVGGSARIPLLADLVAGRLGLPVVIDPFPELTVALGAALFGDGPAAQLALGGHAAAPVAPPDPALGQMAAWFADDGPPASPGPGAGPGAGMLGGGFVDPASEAAAFAPGDAYATDEPGETTWFDDDGPHDAAPVAPVAPGDERHAVAAAFWGGDGDPDWDGPDGAVASAGPADAGGAATFRGPTTGETDLWGAQPARRPRRPRPDDDPDTTGDDAEPRRRLFGENTDSRLVLGIVGAALGVVAIAGAALASGMDDGDDPPIAVIDPVATVSTSTSTSTSTTTTSTSTTTTTEPEPVYAPPETTEPPTTLPPTTTSAPPPATTTTRPPTTTTTAPPTTQPPSTTTSTSTTSTTIPKHP